MLRQSCVARSFIEISILITCSATLVLGQSKPVMPRSTMQEGALTSGAGRAAASTISVAPSSGSGSQQVFTGLYSTSGSSSLQFVQMLLAVAPDSGGQPFCYLHYDVQGNGLYLYSDISGFFVGPQSPGATPATPLQGSSCALGPALSTVNNGTSLSVSFALLFKEAAARNIYLRAVDLDGSDTGWVQHGTWTQTVEPTPSMQVAPASAVGSGVTFELQYSDLPGFYGSPFGWQEFLIAAAPDGGGQPFCFVHYDRAGNGLWLYSSDTGFFLGPVTPGTSSGTLDSSACSVNTAGTTVQNNINGNGLLKLSIPLTLKAPMMTSGKFSYVRTMDVLQRDTGWQQMGTWAGPSYVISGHVTSLGNPLSGTTMTLSGSKSATATTDSSGGYSFAVMAGGAYTVTPVANGDAGPRRDFRQSNHASYLVWVWARSAGTTNWRN